MSVEEQGQIGMDERVIEDPELEALLDARAEAADSRRPYMKAYSEADKAAKDRIEDVVEVGEIVRIGPFRVERAEGKVEHRSFETRGLPKITISAIGD